MLVIFFLLTVTKAIPLDIARVIFPAFEGPTNDPNGLSDNQNMTPSQFVQKAHFKQSHRLFFGKKLDLTGLKLWYSIQCCESVRTINKPGVTSRASTCLSAHSIYTSSL